MTWDLIVSVPDHCLSFYFANRLRGDGIDKQNNKVPAMKLHEVEQHQTHR